MSPPDDDPLTLALQPPPDETPEQRQVREAAEAEAKRVSDEIDEQIKRERENERRKKRPVKLLLLGQSESGKTATLKNFQLTYAKREWSEERASWRAVIFLNLVRNVNEVLEHMSAEMTDLPYPRYPDSDSTEELPIRPIKTLPPLKFKDKHKQLRLQLAPLQQVQRELEQQLGAASTEVYSTVSAPFESQTSSGRRAPSEFSINSSNGWKSALDRFRKGPGNRPEAPNDNNKGKGSRDMEEEMAEIIVSCREDIKALWEDPTVGEALSRRKARIEDVPGFFLNDLERIAVKNYIPSDDDVIRARLRTLGVQEYRFIFDHGKTVGQEWRLYDVGGTRSSRAAWYPYFDDGQVGIIEPLSWFATADRFPGLVSPFDEKLTEDRRVNRLEDSFLLWNQTPTRYTHPRFCAELPQSRK
ncbi:hypothetical protein Ac2012v2_006235 [Leucoagaricus gongylophorus]